MILDDIRELKQDIDELQMKIDSFGTVGAINNARQDFLQNHDKIDWWQMIQLLPSSYNQKRTVMMNYEVIARIIEQRSHHKLDEWHQLVDVLGSLPYMKELIE